MPLSAAATRAALAAQANQVEVVPIQLKFTGGVTFDPDDVYKILALLGVPRIKSPIPARRSYVAELSALEQVLPNPGAEVNTTGWGISNGTGALARVTAGQLTGAGAFQHTTGATPANFDGLVTSPSPDIPAGVRLQSPRMVAVAWVKALDATHTGMRFALEERTAGDASVGFTIVTFTATVNVWTPVFAARAFGATGSKARLIVDHGTNPALTGNRFLVDTAALGVSDSGQDLQIGNASLNPSLNADPTIVELDLALDQGISLPPVSLYDVLDALYPTVYSDKDSVGAQGNYSFAVGP